MYYFRKHQPPVRYLLVIHNHKPSNSRFIRFTFSCLIKYILIQWSLVAIHIFWQTLFLFCHSNSMITIIVILLISPQLMRARHNDQLQTAVTEALPNDIAPIDIDGRSFCFVQTVLHWFRSSQRKRLAKFSQWDVQTIFACNIIKGWTLDLRSLKRVNLCAKF